MTRDTPIYNPDMTLRDYFAAQALACLSPERAGSAAQLAADAFEVADAMLAEREKAGAK